MAYCQYFPKSTSLTACTPEDLHAVEEWLNSRPRKTLNWRTPSSIFHAGLA